MRVLVILLLLLLAGTGLLFLFWEGGPEEKQTAKTETEPPKVTVEKKPEPEKSVQADQTAEKKAVESSPTTSETAKNVIKEAVENAAKPVVVEKPKAPESPKTAEIAPMLAPSFDVVRVDKNCGLLVAGRAEPTAQVTIYANGNPLGSAYASRRGEWVFLATDPLPEGAQEINAKALNPNKRIVETARMVIMQVPDCTKKEEERAPALAVLAPKETDNKTEIENRVSKLLQIPEPKGNVEGAKDLTVGSIDYDNKGNVALAGKGKPGTDVQVYLKNKHIGEAEVDEKGDWKLIPKKEIAPGTYDLRADQVDDEGKVVSRIEIPFQREAAEDVILAKGGLEIRAVVQPGNSLWRIARRMYGEGTQYTLIYQANENQIKDPDLIYPGQIFTLPSKEQIN